MDNHNKKNILIGATGSIAIVKLLEIISLFKENYNISIINLKIKGVVLTPKSIEYFFAILETDQKEFEQDYNCEFFFEKDEILYWNDKKKVLHIEVIFLISLIY